jgi:iron complex transport system permease protein
MTGSLFTAATSLVKYVADPSDKLPAITFWLNGQPSPPWRPETCCSFSSRALCIAPLVLVR